MIKNILNKLLGKKEEQSNLKVEVSFSEPNKQEYVKKEYLKELLNRNLKELGVIGDNCPIVMKS
jgi:hypothetical protein